MQITGKLVAIMPLQTGTTKTGNSWEKQDFVLETTEQYPRKIYITSFGRKNVNIESVTIGTKLTIAIEIESRECNGKWFTNIKCLNITIDEDTITPAALLPTEFDFTPEEEESNYEANLPF